MTEHPSPERAALRVLAEAAGKYLETTDASDGRTGELRRAATAAFDVLHDDPDEAIRIQAAVDEATANPGRGVETGRIWGTSDGAPAGRG